MEVSELHAGYEGLGRVRHGALGAVERARHRSTGEIRLIKAGRAPAAGFARGARRAALADHPGLLRVHGFAHHHGVGILVLADDPGLGLDQLVASGRAPGLAHALDLAVATTTIIAALHRKGLLHGQLCPRSFSVLPTDDGTAEVLLSDLAVAASLPWPAWPAAHRLLYCPPTGPVASTFTAGVERDLFALTLILVELVRHRPRQPGPVAAALATRLARGRLAEDTLDDLPEALTEAVRRGLAAVSGAPPWPSAAPMLAALAEARASLPQEGSPALPPVPPPPPPGAAPLDLEPPTDSDSASQLEQLRRELGKHDAAAVAALDALLRSERPAAAGDREAREVDIVTNAVIAAARSDARRGRLEAAAVKLRRVCVASGSAGLELLDEIEAELWQAADTGTHPPPAGEPDRALPTPAAPTSEVDRHLATAREALAADHLRETIDALRDAGRAAPGASPVQAMVSEALERHLVTTVATYADAGDIAEAWRALAIAERIASRSPAVAEIRRRLEQTSRENQEDAVIALTTSARVLQEEGDHRGALAQLRRAGAVDPGNLEVQALTRRTLELHAEATVAAYLAHGADDEAARVRSVASKHRREPPEPDPSEAPRRLSVASPALAWLRRRALPPRARQLPTRLRRWRRCHPAPRSRLR